MKRKRVDLMETKKKCDFCGGEGEPFNTDPTYEWNYDPDNRPVAIKLEGIYQCPCGKNACMRCRGIFIEDIRTGFCDPATRDHVLRNMSQAEASGRRLCLTCLKKDPAKGDGDVAG